MERRIIEMVQTPRGELQLQERDGHYEIIANGVFIMATYNRHSERELARLPLAAIPAEQGDLRVLVGGLGVGYTLQAVLADSRVRRADVVEIEPRVITWNQQYFASFAGSTLSDPRVRLYRQDVVAYIRDTAVAYHVIALDVDNGPDFLLLEGNSGIYSPGGLEEFRTKLVPGGMLAIWSGQTSEGLAADLTAVFGNCRAVPVPREDNPGLPPDYIYLAGRPES